MHVLTVVPFRTGVRASVIDARERVIGSWVVDLAGGHVESERRAAGEVARAVVDLAVSIAVMHVPFGGEVLGPFEPWSDAVDASIAGIGAEAPMPVVRTLAWARAIRDVLPSMPLLLGVDTAFFRDLPVREALYGLDPDFMKARRIRRYGFHGLFHETACRQVRRRSWHAGGAGVCRIISLCLEPKPELAAVVGSRPVMVTGGMTPAEGLPGEQSCGDLDPAIPLKVAGDQRLGVEQLDRILAHDAGLCALAGRPVTLDDVLHGDDPALEPARELFLHRLLLACGAGVAAMGGLDAIVLSGRYEASVGRLDGWFRTQTARFMAGGACCLHIERCVDSLDGILARGALAYRVQGGDPAAGMRVSACGTRAG